jgi:hypothetical protein
MKMNLWIVLGVATSVLASPMLLELNSGDALFQQDPEAVMRENLRLVKLSGDETKWVSEEEIDSFRRVRADCNGSIEDVSNAGVERYKLYGHNGPSRLSSSTEGRESC